MEGLLSTGPTPSSFITSSSTVTASMVLTRDSFPRLIPDSLSVAAVLTIDCSPGYHLVGGGAQRPGSAVLF